MLLADQDRTRWDRRAILEGLTVTAGALASGPPGRFTLQAAIAGVHRGIFALTNNQNVTIAGIEADARPAIEALIADYGLEREVSLLRQNAMACVALPTCALAMAESERYLPDLITRLDEVIAACGLSDTPITLRMTGCPNGCARPYIAEIGLVGKAPGKYNLYLGAGFHGQRLGKLYRENIGEDAIVEALTPLLQRFAVERQPGEHFGDFPDSLPQSRFTLQMHDDFGRHAWIAEDAADGNATCHEVGKS